MIPLSFFCISFGGGIGAPSNQLVLTVPVGRVTSYKRTEYEIFISL